MSHANDATALLRRVETAAPRTSLAAPSTEDDIAAAYLAGTLKWTGCDWPTQLGSLALNVQGLSSRQAELLSNATAGLERQSWAQAWHWLRQVEHDAQCAEEQAALAYQKAVQGHWLQGRHYVIAALALEGRYRTPVVWQPLCQAIENVITANCG